MIRKEETVTIGKFQKTHALKGELNAIIDIDPSYFEDGHPVIVETDGILVPFFAESIRPKGKHSFLIKLEGVENESEASSFVNHEIMMLKKDAQEWLGDVDSEDYDSLIGYKVIDSATGKEIGEIEDIYDETDNILFSVSYGNESVLIPASEDLIEEIDDDLHTITIHIPEGLLEININ